MSGSAEENKLQLYLQMEQFNIMLQKYHNQSGNELSVLSNSVTEEDMEEKFAVMEEFLEEERLRGIVFETEGSTVTLSPTPYTSHDGAGHASSLIRNPGLSKDVTAASTFPGETSNSLDLDHRNYECDDNIGNPEIDEVSGRDLGDCKLDLMAGQTLKWLEMFNLRTWSSSDLEFLEVSDEQFLQTKGFDDDATGTETNNLEEEIKTETKSSSADVAAIDKSPQLASYPGTSQEIFVSSVEIPAAPQGAGKVAAAEATAGMQFDIINDELENSSVKVGAKGAVAVANTTIAKSPNVYSIRQWMAEREQERRDMNRKCRKVGSTGSSSTAGRTVAFLTRDGLKLRTLEKKSSASGQRKVGKKVNLKGPQRQTSASTSGSVFLRRSRRDSAKENSNDVTVLSTTKGSQSTLLSSHKKTKRGRGRPRKNTNPS